MDIDMYVNRSIKKKFEKIARAYPVTAVVGPRQAGKTTFLKEQMFPNSSYLLFDDPDVRELFEDDIKKFEIQYMKGSKVAILDEVHYCKNAGRKLKYLADSGYKLWVTSSSETLLGKEVLSYLVGRVSILRLYPFSLPEFLRAKKQEATTPKILQRSVWEHLTYGGYPKVVLNEDVELKKMILHDLHNTMLLKDMAQTFSIDDIKTLEDLSRYLSASIGNLLAYEKISSYIGASYQTVKKYLDAMEKSYLITRIPPFCTNKTKEIAKQPKIYFIDTGIRNAISDDFKIEPDGNVFENYVLTELIKMGFFPKHWRSKAKAEVDFIIEKGSEIIPIEVKIQAKKGRIERSLRNFIETYKPKRAFIVTYTGDEAITKINSCKVVHTNIMQLRKHLLTEQ